MCKIQTERSAFISLHCIILTPWHKFISCELDVSASHWLTTFLYITIQLKNANAHKKNIVTAFLALCWFYLSAINYSCIFEILLFQHFNMVIGQVMHGDERSCENARKKNSFPVRMKESSTVGINISLRRCRCANIIVALFYRQYEFSTRNGLIRFGKKG